MKIAVVVCGLFLFIFQTSCKKYSPDASVNKGIEGTWELRLVSGSFQINYQPGNGRSITFTGNTYEMKENGQVTHSGQYQILPDATVVSSTCLNITAGQYTNRIVYDNNLAGAKIFFQLEANKLTTISGCFALDGGSLSEYARIN